MNWWLILICLAWPVVFFGIPMISWYFNRQHRKLDAEVLERPQTPEERQRDAAFDTLVEFEETGHLRNGTRDMNLLYRDWKAKHDAGLLDPDEPHPYWHEFYRRIRENPPSEDELIHFRATRDALREAGITL